MILVFAGAGGSAAVDPEQYSTTIPFFERLPEQIVQSPHFQTVRQFLQTQKKEDELVDIEEVLWGIDELKHFLSEARDTTKITGWLMQAARMAQLSASAVPNNTELLKGMAHIHTQITKLQSDINALVYDFYAASPDDDRLSVWEALLEGIVMRDSHMELFTTNYDLVLERVLEVSGIHTQTGRTQGVRPILDVSLWNTPGLSLTIGEKSYGRLTKLHGSVDWHRGSNIIHTGSPLFTGDHNDHAILYPGYNRGARRRALHKIP